MNPKFSAASQLRLSHAHVDLQRLMNLARDQIAFEIDNGQRAKAAQEQAYHDGKSRAHFGQSPHNWSTALAVDIHPVPLLPTWPVGPFRDLHHVIGQYNPTTQFGSGLAKQLLIPITWGGDWDGDGLETDQTLHDLPHYEVFNWRELCKTMAPYTG